MPDKKELSDEEKLMKMFVHKHGVPTLSCSAETVFDEEWGVECVAIALMKDGMECWRETKLDLLFYWMTRDMER